MTLPVYLSGGRIQGKTTDESAVTTVQGTDNPTLDFDFSSTPTDWNYRIAGSTSHWDNDSSRLNWETKSAGSGSGADYDLGVAQTENWVLRFKFSIDSSQSGYVSAGQGDGILIFGLQNYPSTSAYTASTPNSANDSTYAENHQMAQAMLILKPNQSYWKIGGRCEVTDSANFGSAQLEENISQDTNYWVEVRRTSATTFTIKAFTNSNYSSNQVGSTGTYTVTSGLLDDLRYIHFEEHAQNVGYDSYGGGILTDLEFWGTTIVAKDKSTITNVPIGTRYEETDTRKIFRRKAGASTTATQETAAESTSLDSGSKGAGQYIRTTSSAFYGKILTDVQFKLHSTTAQAGAKVYARHYNSSDVLIHTYWEKLASALPSSSTWTTETTLAGDTVFANGDYFVCEYMETDGTTATGSVYTQRKHNDSGTKYDGSNSGFINTYFGSSSFLDTGARDAWFKITISDPDTWVQKGTA